MVRRDLLESESDSSDSEIMVHSRLVDYTRRLQELSVKDTQSQSVSSGNTELELRKKGEYDLEEGKNNSYGLHASEPRDSTGKFNNSLNPGKPQHEAHNSNPVGSLMGDSSPGSHVVISGELSTEDTSKSVITDNEPASKDRSPSEDRQLLDPPLARSVMPTHMSCKITPHIPLEKVTITFQPIGSIPQIIPRQVSVKAAQPFSVIVAFLTKKLARHTDHICCYINGSFAPPNDEEIGNLFRNFNVNQELIVSYCATVAFG